MASSIRLDSRAQAFACRISPPSCLAATVAPTRGNGHRPTSASPFAFNDVRWRVSQSTKDKKRGLVVPIKATNHRR